MQHHINWWSAALMYCAWNSKIFWLKTCFPNLIASVSIIHLFKNSITSNYYKVIIRLNSETSYLWCGYDNVRISTITFIFCFNISDCPWDWEPSRENSIWSNKSLLAWGIVWWRIWNLTLILVNFASKLFNTLCFIRILRFVVRW